MSSEAQFGLVMPFVTVASRGGPHDDQSYVAGYEMGKLDELLETCRPHEATIRSGNLAQADLLAMRHHFAMKVLSDDGDWATVSFTPIDPEPDTAAEGMECGITSPEVPGFGFAYCELKPGHNGPHREREDGHVWPNEGEATR